MKIEYDKNMLEEALGEIETRGYNVQIRHPYLEGPDTKSMDELITDCHKLASKSFGKYIHWRAIDGRSRESYSILLLTHNDEKVGYAVNDRLLINNRLTNYFSTGMIIPDHQGKGLYSWFNQVRQAILPDAEVVLTRTQNPVVYKGFTNYCNKYGFSNIYPESTTIPDNVVEFVRQWDPDIEDSLISKKIYFGRELMGSTPAPDSLLIQKLWNQINTKQGDAYVVIGHRPGIL